MLLNDRLPNEAKWIMNAINIRPMGISEQQKIVLVHSSSDKYSRIKQFQEIDASKAAKALAVRTVLLLSMKGASYMSFWDKLKLCELLRLVPSASELEHH